MRYSRAAVPNWPSRRRRTIRRAALRVVGKIEARCGIEMLPALSDAGSRWGTWRGTAMPPDGLDRASYWRSLATDTLIAATETTDPRARSLLVSISAVYDTLARQAEASNPSTPTVLPMILTKKP